MILAAQISATGDALKAVLSDGRILTAPDVGALAALLVAAGVPVDHAHCGDWRDGDLALGAGQAIALKMEMRRLLLPS